jgi:hypothetical protein
MKGTRSLLMVPAVAAVVLLGSASASGRGHGVFDANRAKTVPASRTGRAATAPIGRYLLQTRGLWAEFEDLHRAYGYYDGELLDALAARSVQQDVTAQLVHMRAMGVNEFGFELTAGDGNQATAFPDCKLSTFLGPQWPQPTAAELTGLSTVFDLAQRQGMKVMLILDSTHMEEQPPTNAQQWLGAILNDVKNKPALDLVAFGGDRHLVANNPPFHTPDSCGEHAEAPLWLGPDSPEARYVQWAIGYGMTLGLLRRS